MFAAALDPNGVLVVDRVLLPKEKPLAELDEVTGFAVALADKPNPPKGEDPNNVPGVGGAPASAADCLLQTQNMSEIVCVDNTEFDMNVPVGPALFTWITWGEDRLVWQSLAALRQEMLLNLAQLGANSHS